MTEVWSPALPGLRAFGASENLFQNDRHAQMRPPRCAPVHAAACRRARGARTTALQHGTDQARAHAVAHAGHHPQRLRER